ncbi:MAG: hypothetical protein KA347_09325 [Bacteroidia bacterium]|jgi:hypothetical protein|nr:hypothetical protein [Bacteroidota bacterium]MBP6512858.1 hypothetical protein [Bacteroidia bacterium]MBP7245491.1 hypothetical protein [Bacteroidia bacterium]
MNDLQLEKYRHDLAYLKAMAAQTIKDFDRFNYTLVFNEGLPVQFNNYCIQLAEQLQFWCKFDADRIPGLLYHIDIPEHMIPARYGCRDTAHMADVILQRELIKVILRKHYSS